jgi:uncharacterized protein YjiS (DUF1127 family)
MSWCVTTREEQPVARKHGAHGPARGGKAKEFAMFDTLVSRARASIAKRKRYNQLVNEINSLSERDLADIRASRSDMLHHAHKQIYG